MMLYLNSVTLNNSFGQDWYLALVENCWEKLGEEEDFDT